MNGVIVENLMVRYGDICAVNDVSFHAQCGQVTAILGPNGAGKTSAIEVCEGFRQSNSGQVQVLGLHPIRDHDRLTKRMGVMLQGGGVYPSARVCDVVQLFCDIHDKRCDAGELIALVGLEERRQHIWKRLSGGEQQRVSLALVLAAQPDVVFLDEPTSGVDVNGRLIIRDIVTKLAHDGCTVLLATHELSEAEKVADHIVIFDHGRVAAAGSIAQLRRGHEYTRFTSDAGIDIAELSRALGCRVTVTHNAGEYNLELLSTPAIIAVLSSWLHEKNLPLHHVSSLESLEDMFSRIVAASENKT
ncbi:MAG: ABC transporter ATP-binding protein [Ilumatobacteraceae bacterium]|nr:ABC transporter ATP-binding protein [Ilumatobacteraceae bacterium]